MAKRLGEILVAGKVVSPADLKKALDSQLIFGGRLGTNLLDLGLLDEQSLTTALEEQKRVAVATPEMLDKASPEALRLVPATLADRHVAVPFELDGTQLKVAMLDPLDLIAIDELAFASGCVVIPYLAPEIRLVSALERCYGVTRPARFVKLAADAPARPGHPLRSKPRVVVEEALGLARGAVVTPQALRASPPQAMDAVLEELKRRTGRQPADVQAAGAPTTLADVAARLADAGSRDDIGEALVALARTRFSRVATWLIQKDRALGWLGSVDGLAPESARRLARAASASLAEPSVLAQVVSGKQYYMGELPLRPGDERVASLFGPPRPSAILLLPVFLADQVIIVLECDDAERPFGQFDLRSLKLACQKAGLAMEALLLRARIRQGV